MRVKSSFLFIFLCLIAFAGKGAGLGPYGVHVNIPFNGVATQFLNGTGTFSTPAGGGSGGSTNWVDVGTNSYTLGNVGIGTTPIAAQKMTLEVNNLTTLPINGLFLTNATAATAGVTVQDSPAIYWSGGAWLTGSLSNAPVSWRTFLAPVAGSTTPGASLIFAQSLNGAPFVNMISMDSGGGLNLISGAGSIFSGNGVFAAASGNNGWNGRSAFTSSINGAIEANNSTATARSTLQHNIPQITKTSNYTIVALDSGLQFDNIGASATNRLDLPVAVAKMRYLGYVDAAFRMQFQAQGSDIIRDGSTVSGAAAGIWADAPGECIELFAPKAGVWVVRSKTGTWTIE